MQSEVVMEVLSDMNRTASGGKGDVDSSTVDQRHGTSSQRSVGFADREEGSFSHGFSYKLTQFRLITEI